MSTYRIQKSAIDNVAALYQAGITLKKIAEATGLSFSNVRHLVYKHLQANRRNLKKNVKLLTAVKKIHALGKTDSEIGQSVKNGKGTLAERRWEADKFEAFLQGAPIGITTAQYRIYSLIVKHGAMSIAEISDLLGHAVQKPTLYQLRDNGHIEPVEPTRNNQPKKWRIALAKRCAIRTVKTKKDLTLVETPT